MRIFRDQVGAVNNEGGNGGSGYAPAEGGGRRRRRRRRRKRSEDHPSRELDPEIVASAEEVLEVTAGRNIVEAAIARARAVGKPMPTLASGSIQVRQWREDRPLEEDAPLAPMVPHSSQRLNRRGPYTSLQISDTVACRLKRGTP